MFLTRFAGLSTTEFAIGITVAGVVGLVLGGPAGYLADRLGARETLMVIGAVQRLAVCSFAFTRQFWGLAAITCLAVGAERTAPAFRIALIAGLTSGEQRLNSLATARSLTQSGMVVGALLGALVRSLDNRPAYVSLVFGYGAACFCFTLLLTHVPHVASLRDRKVRRKALAVRDRPFLAICGFNGMLALSWALLDVVLPLWISAHTGARPAGSSACSSAATPAPASPRNGVRSGTPTGLRRRPGWGSGRAWRSRCRASSSRPPITGRAPWSSPYLRSQRPSTSLASSASSAAASAFRSRWPPTTPTANIKACSAWHSPGR
ncbi:MFS transporter [Micromonospora sp. LOL_014]|uniref:MFS transporter n=1 Tax=Micromonospora sp. LOL_014 TaxID=3345415 RepID=UPI003A899777